MTFDPLDPQTYPPLLTDTHMAAIYHTTPAALRQALRRKRFAPTPYRTRPNLWRRADVLADVVGPVGAVLRIRQAS